MNKLFSSYSARTQTDLVEGGAHNPGDIVVFDFLPSQFVRNRPGSVELFMRNENHPAETVIRHINGSGELHSRIRARFIFFFHV